MNRVSVLVAACVAGVAAPAGAVDLVNRDRVGHDVVINRSDGSSEEITIKAREKLAGVCKACVVVVADSTVEATGDVTVTIEGG
jgi:hypothetical protein